MSLFVSRMGRAQRCEESKRKNARTFIKRAKGHRIVGREFCPADASIDLMMRDVVKPVVFVAGSSASRVLLGAMKGRPISTIRFSIARQQNLFGRNCRNTH